MDLATLIGIIVAFTSILVGMILEGGNPASLISPSAFMIVIPTTFGVSLAGGYLKDIGVIVAATKNAFMTKTHDPGEAIELMVKFAEKARREGLLALEEAVKDVEDPFLKKGVEMAVDGTDPEQLREILEAEIAAKKKLNKIPAAFFTSAGGYAPTIGIIGTVLGLVHVLHNLSDAAALGPAISAAFIATLFGVSSANIVYLPVATRLKRLAEEEAHHMEAVVEGIVAIQAGSNPRVIQQKLNAYMGIAPSGKDKDKAA